MAAVKSEREKKISFFFFFSRDFIKNLGGGGRKLPPAYIKLPKFQRSFSLTNFQKEKKKTSFVPMRLAGWQAQGVLQVQAFDGAKFSAKITFTR